MKELKKERGTTGKRHTLWYPGQRIFIVDIDDISSILHKFVGGRLVEKPYRQFLRWAAVAFDALSRTYVMM